ncbi:MAG: glycosyltransferase [Methanobacteriaceae archaeon]|jgi:GT2 family glycosyltransferase/spore maturation protein CgeB|nr:glycosyltransferase [Candidatus Methanorudis spinitermitis]
MKSNIKDNSVEIKNVIVQNRVSFENPFFNESPLVSILIVNKNGIHSLKRLFKNFENDIVYPNYEIIVVDDNSNDNSLDFLEKKGKHLPLIIIKNSKYKTFSEANNQGAKVAKGDYLLLLNSNIEPTYGWLNEMMGVMLNNDNVGLVGAKLVYPNIFSYKDKNKSFKVQHAGIAFKSEGLNFHPFNVGNGLNLFDPSIKTETVLAVTAATLLVKKSVYEELGGLDERYVYEYADIDLALKLLEDDYNNYLCSTALLFNHEPPINLKNMKKDVLKRTSYDFELLNRKWGTYLFKKTFKDKLNSKHFSIKEPLKIGLVVTETGDESRAGDFFTALELAEEFKKIGYEVTFINRKDKIINGHIDVVINFLHKFNISSLKLKENTLKIAWMRNWFDKWVKNRNINDYDVYFASSQTACDYVTKYLGKEVFLLPIATNPYRFQIKNSIKKYECDYCFTGSYWNSPREITELLDPDSLNYSFSIYGENWNKIKKFRPYNKGFINYSDIQKVYASTKLVIDDANHVTKKYGAVNSRVFDAIASGTLVITNGIIGANETFNGKLPCFNSKSELTDLIKFYLENEKERIDKVNELKDFVLKNHTYEKRVLTIKNIIEKEFKNY